MKIVFTGGPSVGKSTILTELAWRGYSTVCERARLLIEAGVSPKENVVEFQRAVLNEQLRCERMRNDKRLYFFDRGVYDGIAYCWMHGEPVPEFFQSLPQKAYDMAFLFEPLPFFENDGARTEDLNFTREITHVLRRVYENRGVTVVWVPVMPVGARLNLLLRYVRNHCLASEFSARKLTLRQKIRRFLSHKHSGAYHGLADIRSYLAVAA